MENPPAIQFLDSGYHGSQGTQVVPPNVSISSPHGVSRSPVQWGLIGRQVVQTNEPASTAPTRSPPTQEDNTGIVMRTSMDRSATEASFVSAKEDPSMPVPAKVEGDDVKLVTTGVGDIESADVVLESASKHRSPLPVPMLEPETEEPTPRAIESQQESPSVFRGDQIFVDAHSPTEDSSPLRPIVRKSSLNFASLPAREPLTTKKSIGARNSRTSQLEANRASYYPHQTGGHSIGGTAIGAEEQERDDTNMDDMDVYHHDSSEESNTATLHNKTSTQRLQDQISMLGKSQPQQPRHSKSIPSIITLSQPAVPAAASPAVLSSRIESKKSMPGAFADEDEDSWIGSSTAKTGATSSDLVPTVLSPRAERPAMIKNNTTASIETIEQEGAYFAVPKQRSPTRDIMLNADGARFHTKSASTSIIHSPTKSLYADVGLKKTISASNPDLSTLSPSRSIRDSPLKAAKDKISSILKTSRGLFASSAAVSAEAYSSVLEPTSPGKERTLEDALNDAVTKGPSLYPSLSQTLIGPDVPRKTRASTEREEKRLEKEAKEARQMQEQLDRLEKAREKESQKARIFSQEKERIAAMEKQALEKKALEKNEQEADKQIANVEAPKATRSSPRKTKADLEAKVTNSTAATSEDVSTMDIDMANASSVAPATSHRAEPSGLAKAKEVAKRITRPGPPSSTRGAKPVHIRVGLHNAAHGGVRGPALPSNNALAAGLGESLARSNTSNLSHGNENDAASRPGLKSKASTSSMQSLKNTAATKKVAALSAAARKKEQDEKEAQKRRDLKVENERRRAAEQEHRRQEEERIEAERRRELRELTAKKKVDAQRQVIEKAKAERPPPPPSRGRVVEQNAGHDKPLPAAPREAAPSRPVSRMNTIRPQDDAFRAQPNAAQSMTKQPPKRPLTQDIDDFPRPPMHRNPASYTQNADKRRKTGEEMEDTSNEPLSRPHIGAPIRTSTMNKPKVRPLLNVQYATSTKSLQDILNKSYFSNGYTNATGPPQLATAQMPQGSRMMPAAHAKIANPMDMAQISKAAVPFSSQSAQYKTPARPMQLNGKSTGKTATRSSPRYQNGEHIELPEIHTDSEDEDSDDGGKDFAAPDWVDSPALRAGLVAQEGIDPVTVFGRPGELKMEEVFRNKERWGRFRQRTSSANWSGSDRLTEEEVRSDLEARERLRREGAWSYGMS